MTTSSRIDPKARRGMSVTPRPAATRLWRWRDAVAAGTPALAVHAGEMSRPILETLGFEQVAEVEQLYDPATT